MRYCICMKRMKSTWMAVDFKSLAVSRCRDANMCLLLLVYMLVPFNSLTYKLFAQWDVQWSDYTRMKSFYNPAVSGTDGKLNVAGAYSMQFAGYDGAPQTMYIGADLPIYFLGPRHGGGVSFMNDEIGIFSTKKISLQYALNFTLGKKKQTKLAVGLQGALLSENINTSDLELEDQSDQAFPTSEVDGNGLDVGVGLYLYNPKYWLSASVQHATAPLLEMGETYEVQLDRVYYLMGGGNIKLKNSTLSLQPSFLVQTDIQSWREDIQCKVTYEYEERKFYAGVGYSPKTSATVLLGGVFHGICLGYSYQIYTQGIEMVNGSHELVISYQSDLDLFKKGRNRHKSVRFL